MSEPKTEKRFPIVAWTNDLIRVVEVSEDTYIVEAIDVDAMGCKRWTSVLGPGKAWKVAR